MTAREIAYKYGLNLSEFIKFLHRHREIKIKTGILDEKGITVYADDIPRLVEKYKEEAAQAEKQAKARVIKEQEKNVALPKILITSGYSFEGYKITKYSGYISGDDAVQIPRSGVFGGNNGQNLTNALVRIRIQALKELKEAAYDLDCNAVIGVDFDYITLEPETANIGGGTLYEPYIICVTANGNAVVIEKE